MSGKPVQAPESMTWMRGYIVSGVLHTASRKFLRGEIKEKEITRYANELLTRLGQPPMSRLESRWQKHVEALLTEKARNSKLI